jgi:beta-lactam-binding protein with PASTA domain
VIVLLLLLIAFFGFGSVSSSGESKARAVPAARVPAVTGFATPNAERRIRQAGLVPAQTWCRARASVYAVRGQLPAAGTTVPRGSRVTLRLAPAQGQGIPQMPCNAYTGARP